MPNIYAALSTAVLLPLVCLVVVLVVFINAYQVTGQWKAYDDLYRGRTNGTGTHTYIPTAQVHTHAHRQNRYTHTNDKGTHNQWHRYTDTRQVHTLTH